MNIMTMQPSMHLLDLHLVHDPERAEVTVTALAQVGDKRQLHEIEGRYHLASEAPAATLDFNREIPDEVFGPDTGANKIISLPPYRFKLTLGCEIETTHFKRSLVPTGAVSPAVTVWAVVFSNYEPPEVAALYDNEAAARSHATALGDGWNAVPWSVGSSYEPAEQRP